MRKMDIRQISHSLSVSPQISIQDVAIAAEMGFKSIICNRPANETEDQPDLDEIASACKKQGIAYHHQPVISGQITDQDVDAFEALFAGAEGPVLAFCRTGTRCATLWLLSESKHQDTQTLLATAKAAGYDLSNLVPRIQAMQQVQNTSPEAQPVLRRHEVLIVGGGAGGLAVAGSLLKRQPDIDIGLIEPRAEHYYQPGWTLVGAGVFQPQATVRKMSEVMPKKVHWYKAWLEKFEPQNNQVVLADGETIGYTSLIVSPGLDLHWEGVRGLKDSLGSNGVTSNYKLELAPYTWELVQSTKKGKAIFTQPPMPIKCAGAPQKPCTSHATIGVKILVLQVFKLIFALQHLVFLVSLTMCLH